MEYEIHSAYMGASSGSSPSQGSSHRNYSGIYEQSRQRIEKHFKKRFPKERDSQLEKALRELQAKAKKQEHKKH